MKLASFLFVVAAAVALVNSPASAGDHETRRAVLGLSIASAGMNGSPAEGVTVVGVTPGGPAAAAGLRAGDVLVEIGNRSLTADSQRAANNALLDFMSSVSPGDEIRLRYLRGGKVAKARLTAEELNLAHLPGDVPFMRDLERWGEEFRSRMGDGRMPWVRRHGPFAGMELVTLTDDLGAYFGTTNGLLVVRAPANASLELRDGDVIQQIGGRTPNDPRHALRILRSYAPGEKLVIDIVRKERPQELTIRLPEIEPAGSARAQGNLRLRRVAPRHAHAT